VNEAGRKTTSRRDLSRNPRFEQISPEVGELDESAVDEAMSDSPDDVMALLADLTGATDPTLRELAKRLAARLFLDVSRRGPVRPRGVGKLVSQPFRPDGGDLDIDASLDAIAEAVGGRHAVDPERLRIRGWTKPGTALCLMVDRSGSMGGKPLATSAVAAAAVAWRAPSDYSVIAFGKDIVVAKAQDVYKDSDRVITDVLALRGFGTTDLAGALLTAGLQLSRSRAGRRIAVLLSDCRATVEGDVIAAAGALDELLIIAPEGDAVEAEKLATRVGAKWTTASGPSAVGAALSQLLDD
jgi:Mg-chelatase subunit ChlD